MGSVNASERGFQLLYHEEISILLDNSHTLFLVILVTYRLVAVNGSLRLRDKKVFAHGKYTLDGKKCFQGNARKLPLSLQIIVT